MSHEPEHFTVVQRELTRIRRNRRRYVLGALFLAGLIYMASFFIQRTEKYESAVNHFKYGSIGSEPRSGIPKDFWLALPYLYPEELGTKDRQFTDFGFLFEHERELPIGVSQRRVNGVEMVWLNCATCHTGSYKKREDQEQAVIVPGMPANSLELARFTQFVLTLADQELKAKDVFQAMEKAGQHKNWIQKQFWRFIVLPRLRAGMSDLRDQLKPLLDFQKENGQDDWGIGRVDTFNPYKVTQFGKKRNDFDSAEVIGASDFPSIFLQAPREGMQLHWDGNNTSLKERNLSASLGAGVFPNTVDHRSVNRVANWLLDLEPPSSPHRPKDNTAYSSAVKQGYSVYQTHCATCHGYFDLNKNQYVFEGEKLGTVEPIEKIGTDRRRLDSYTVEFRNRQITELFSGTEHQFKHFTKTNGYANGPLDGLWLRGPYFHNGAVPTLWDVLLPPEKRPEHFMRDSKVLDLEKGGFVSPPCPDLEQRNCFDTSEVGNSNSGHVYGTDLSITEREQLLEYLKTF